MTPDILWVTHIYIYQWIPFFSELLSHHKQLEHIYLHTNELTEIEATALQVQSPDLKEIDLSNNQINDVEPGAFDCKYRG